MKSFNFLWTVVLVLSSIAITSCDKDDDSSSADGPNEISIGNQTFSIASSFKRPGNLISEGVYEHEIYFLGNGLTHSDNGTISGEGSMVYANIYTDSENGLVAGTYNYPPFGENAGAFSIRFVTAGVNLDFDDPNGTNPENISNGSSGSVTISGTGADVQMIVDITATNTNKIEADFKGSLPVVQN
jgi:hypothetical protein